MMTAYDANSWHEHATEQNERAESIYQYDRVPDLHTMSDEDLREHLNTLPTRELIALAIEFRGGSA